MARLAADAIREQVQRRYGIDVDALGTGADGAAALREAARAKTQAQEERTAAAGENVQAAQLLAEAERADRAQRQNVQADNTARPGRLADEATVTYDSAERREAFARSLSHIGDREAVEARLIAERNQATPPTAAIMGTQSNNLKARPSVGAWGSTRQSKNGATR